MEIQPKTGLPRFYPSAYDTDEIKTLVNELALGEITDEKVDTLAQAVHKATPWAGRPLRWERMTDDYRHDHRYFARWALEQAQAPAEAPGPPKPRRTRKPKPEPADG